MGSLKNFFSHNKKILKTEKKDTKVLIADRCRFFDSIIYSVLGAAFCNKKNLNALIMFNKKNLVYKQIFKSFGFNKFFYEFDKINIFNFFICKKIIETLFLFSKDIFKIKFKGFEWFGNNYKIKNVPMGDLIYNTYVRYDHSYLNPKLDFKFLRIFFSVILKSLLILDIIKKRKIKFAFSSGSPYASNNGIFFRISTFKKIKVIKLDLVNENFIGFNVINKYFRFNNFSSYLNLKHKKFFIEINKLKNPKLNSFINARNYGKLRGNFTNINDLKKANKSKFVWDRKSIIKKIFKSKNFGKKIILIAPHAFSDAPYSEGVLIFRDYYSHLEETLNFIENENLQNVFWLVKPHPSRSDYNENGIIENLMKKYKNRNLALSPANLSAINSTKICDNVITSNGSISFEFACEGKYPILASKAIYSKLGFTIDHETKENYFHTLKNIHKIKSLNKKQINLSKRILYGLERIYPHNILSKSNIFDKEVLSNISQNKNLIFSDKFIKNIKKKCFLNDKMTLSFVSQKI